jgi:AhpD family alkylhydroperoxidase
LSGPSGPSWGCFLASACAVGEPETLKAIDRHGGARGRPSRNEAFAAAKDRRGDHGHEQRLFPRPAPDGEAPEYQTLPSRLRMNRLAHHPGVEAVDYELWCVAVSAINGCGACLDSHEAELRERGVTPRSGSGGPAHRRRGERRRPGAGGRNRRPSSPVFGRLKADPRRPVAAPGPWRPLDIHPVRKLSC